MALFYLLRFFVDGPLSMMPGLFMPGIPQETPMMRGPLSRRLMVKSLTLAAASAAVASRTAIADADKLAVSDPAAVAVGYVEDAAHADRRKFPSYVKGSNCANCLLLQGKEGSAYRPCSLFKGKLVASAGWCSAWAAEI
jgi:hypothetical protein